MTTQGFTLRSPAFRHDHHLPDSHTCQGEGVSPELTWSHPPAGVQSYALIMEDLDAHGSVRTHWLIYDIPGARKALDRNVHAVGRPGRNDRQHLGYGEPCPPPNHGHHRYRFSLSALDLPTLGLDDGATREALEDAMQGHVLGRAELVARCQRTTG